jgi:hypothetical protein
MTEDFKIVPDRDDLKLEARLKRREEAERAVKEFETRKRLEELKSALLSGLDMSIGVMFLTKSILALDGDEVLEDKEFLKLLNRMNDLTEEIAKKVAR